MFQAGHHYSRANDIHDRFGGGRQGGISASSQHPFVFLFTGESGEAFGYEDGWQQDEGVFLYTGEGQLGDMEFSRGNRALRDHTKDGKQLLVFKALGKGKPVEFLGEFNCVSYDYGRGLDRDGNMRRTIRFHLMPIDNDQPDAAPEPPALVPTPPKSLAELRTKALSATVAGETSNWKETKQLRRQRNNAIKEYVLARAAGHCELTGEPAPFTTADGKPFLEVHHIKRLSDGGLDHPANCAAITPNVHREIHFGANGAEIDDQLVHIIADKEA